MEGAGSHYNVKIEKCRNNFTHLCSAEPGIWTSLGPTRALIVLFKVDRFVALGLTLYLAGNAQVPNFVGRVCRKINDLFCCGTKMH